jgi:hypothetical protein
MDFLGAKDPFCSINKIIMQNNPRVGKSATIDYFSESIDEENTYLLRPELSHGNVLISGESTLRPAAT